MNMNAQELIETLEWRYATKVFNPDRRIPAEMCIRDSRSLMRATEMTDEDLSRPFIAICNSFN